MQVSCTLIFQLNLQEGYVACVPLHLMCYRRLNLSRYCVSRLSVALDGAN